ncbi:MAG: hypothetical protein KDA69_15805, partial [Planctomycetaceae bacterium]|nr:hypothetical protein [Planctomycetaceae bacterium]
IAVADDFVRDLNTTEYGIITMCSSTGRELSAESHKHQHGYFTVALKEGLSGQQGQGSELKPDYNNDGAIDWKELDSYVTARVKELSNGQQHPVSAHNTNVRSFPITRLR